jgi:hypothetical protein
VRGLFYRLLGQAVWTALVWYLRRKNGRLLVPRKAVAGGAGALVVGVALAAAAAARRGGPSGQMRA